MAARSFNPDTEDEQQTKDEEGQESVDRDEVDSPSEQEAEEHQPPPKKKRAAPEQREWTAVNRWHHSDSTPEEIMGYIRSDLNELNRNAGIQDLPGSHKDRKDVYGNFQFRRTWSTSNDLVTNTIVNCPLLLRCG